MMPPFPYILGVSCLGFELYASFDTSLTHSSNVFFVTSLSFCYFINDSPFSLTLGPFLLEEGSLRSQSTSAHKLER